MDAVALFDPVDRADVRMVERREHPRFALEAGQPVGIRGEGTRQNLERDVAPELRVARAIHLAHAARPEQCLDLIDADASPGQHGSAGVGDDPGRRRERRLRQEAGGLALVRQQRCHFLLERVIAGARLAQESGAIARVTRQRGVIDLRDLLPAVGIHAAALHRGYREHADSRPLLLCHFLFVCIGRKHAAAANLASGATRATVGKTPRRAESRPGHGPGRRCAHVPGEAFSRAVERFAEQHVSESCKVGPAAGKAETRRVLQSFRSVRPQHMMADGQPVPKRIALPLS